MSQELVVFNYARVEGALQLDSRTFSFYRHDLYIKQKWAAGGKGGSNIGHGCSVYNCSFVLAKYMENHPHELGAKHCIEIGCGPGLTSIACSLAQPAPASIIATDGDEISVQLAKENIEVNMERVRRCSDIIPCPCEAKKLLWGDLTDMQAFKKFDCVLAADVVAVPYESAYEALLTTMLYLLKPDGCVWLCYQQRHASEIAFFSRFHEVFDIERIDRSCIHEDFQDALVPIQLYKAKPKVDAQLK